VTIVLSAANEGASMRGRSIRGLLTAALLCSSAWLLACPLGRLHILIPDFVSSDVRGVRLYRVDEGTGQLAAAGHIEFLAIEAGRDGEKLKYLQFDAAGDPWLGPIYTPAIRDPAQPAALEITVAMLNGLPAGWFKVASYNQYGTSPPSSGQTFVIGQEG
jgi:hypothetical protein